MTGRKREFPLPIEEGSYMKHITSSGETTIWRVLSLEHKDGEGLCEIQLLHNSTESKYNMHAGDACTYQKSVLQYYDLWELVSEEEAVFGILGGLE